MTEDNKEIQMVDTVDTNAQDTDRHAEPERVKSKNKKKKWMIVVVCVLGLACIIGLMVWLFSSYIPDQNYKKALRLLREGRYAEAEKCIAKSKRSRAGIAADMEIEKEYDAIIALMNNSTSQEELDAIMSSLCSKICFIAVIPDEYDISEEERNDIIRGLTEAWIDQGGWYPSVALKYLEDPNVNHYCDADLLNVLFRKAYAAKYGEETASLFLDNREGEIIGFGSYEQDNNLSNGKEIIKWRVLSREGVDYYGMRILLVADQVLDTCPECDTADLWLNSVFINSAFREDEQRLIGDATVYQKQWAVMGDQTSPDGESRKVFCITEDMLDEYFPKASDRRCRATDYVKYSRQIQEDSEGYCTWRAYKVEYGITGYQVFDYVVYSNGKLNDVHTDSREDIAKSGVRPAMIIWLH